MGHLTLKHAQFLTHHRVLSPATVVVDNGRILYIGSEEDAPRISGPCVDVDGDFVVPGLIDLHVHGGHGITFGNTPTLAEDLHTYSAWVTSAGVTGFLCSIAAPDRETLLALVKAYADILDAGDFPGAEPLGLHLEGPYLNPEKNGAFHRDWLRAPDLDEVRALLDAGRGWIRQMTLAPELPGALEVAALLHECGIVAALGHSDADYETASAALRGDFTHVTHTFNAQRGFHHRDPGVLGAILTSDNVTAELIADTIHVHPGAMHVLLHCLGPERIVLVSDAMAAAGLDDGEYALTGNAVTVTDSIARNEHGAIAGSTTTLDVCVRNVRQHLDVSLTEAVRMASHNPACVLGMERDIGCLDVGKPANLLMMNEAGTVHLTVVHGKIKYKTDACSFSENR